MLIFVFAIALIFGLFLLGLDWPTDRRYRCDGRL